MIWDHREERKMERKLLKKKLALVKTRQPSLLAIAKMSTHVWRWKVRISMTFTNANKETGQCNYDEESASWQRIGRASYLDNRELFSSCQIKYRRTYISVPIARCVQMAEWKAQTIMVRCVEKTNKKNWVRMCALGQAPSGIQHLHNLTS